MSEIIELKQSSPCAKTVRSKSKLQAWRTLVEEQMRSGQSIRVFCVDRQIKINTFHYWKKKFRGNGSRATSRFTELSLHKAKIPMPSNSTSRSPRIHLPNGVWVELGEGLESVAVNHLIQNLCGVPHAKS